MTTENDRSSFENLLLTARWNWSSTHQFPARIIYHAITDTRRGSKKRRSQTSPPLPPLITHSSYPAPPLPSIFHHSVLPPVPIWYHIQTLILFKCSTKFFFQKINNRWNIFLILSQLMTFTCYCRFSEWSTQEDR